MLRISVLAAVLTMFAAAAAAADDILLLPNGRGEALALVVPPGWEVVAEPAAAPDAPTVLAPVGAGAAAPERIEIERLPAAEGGTDGTIDALEAAWRAGCEAVQYGSRRPFLTHGFSGIVTTIGCTRRLDVPTDGTEQGEIWLLTLVPGQDMLWSLRRIWVVPAYDVMATPVSAERMRTGAEQVGRFALCKADAPSETCPPEVATAIGRAGSATAPIILP